MSKRWVAGFVIAFALLASGWCEMRAELRWCTYAWTPLPPPALHQEDFGVVTWGAFHGYTTRAYGAVRTSFLIMLAAVAGAAIYLRFARTGDEKDAGFPVKVSAKE